MGLTNKEIMLDYKFSLMNYEIVHPPPPDDPLECQALLLCEALNGSSFDTTNEIILQI